MENFKTESRYQDFYYEFRAFIRCMETAFYRPDYQNLDFRAGFVCDRAFESLREN